MQGWLSVALDQQQTGLIQRHLAELRIALSRYLPQHLLDWLAEESLGNRPRSEFLRGAVLFADVSGFTAMSEKLQALGREGAEEITLIVNGYFSRMLEISDAMGGDLLKFGGDALLILFEDPNGPLRALDAAQRMQQAMEAYRAVETSQGVFPLQMKIGIGSGRVLLTTLGTSERMNYAVMGKALTRMSGAEAAATAGEIVVDDATHAACESTVAFERVEGQLWRLTELQDGSRTMVSIEGGLGGSAPAGQTDSADREGDLRAELERVEQLIPFLPPELVERLVADPLRPIEHGTHRPVTVMFANFDGTDELIEALGPGETDAVTAILNAYYVRMSSILAEFGGTISRVDNYLTGHRLLALFGALRAHEDDPQRAVAAGLQMQRTLLEVNQETASILHMLPDRGAEFGDRPIRQRIGVNSGFVFAGDVGGDRRREFTVMGDEVNLTARIMSVAQFDELLIGDATQRQLGQLTELEARDPVKVKGKTRPVKTYRVQSMRLEAGAAPSLGSTPMVGRERELSLLEQRTEQALTGHGQIVEVSAAAGLGKTRLIAEAVLNATNRRLALVSGDCKTYGTHAAYSVWDPIWRGLLKLDRSLSAEDQTEELAATLHELDPALAPRLPLLGAVLNLTIPENQLTRHFDAKLRKTLRERTLVELLQSIAKPPGWVLVLEDVQWIDPLSTDLLLQLGEAISGLPVLVLMAGRSEGQDEGEASPMADWPHYTRIALGELPAQQAEQLITIKLEQQFGPDTHPPREFVKRLLTRAEGNPFYIEQVLTSLQDRSISLDDLAALSKMELPAGLHSLILSRIDELGQRPRSTLRVASVFGRSFKAPHLTGAYPELDGEFGIRSELDELDHKSFIVLESAADQAYLFRQGVIQEVAYETLAFNLRRTLHVNIAGFIEKIEADSLETQVDLLAHHYFKGGAWPKALEFTVKSARKAQRDFANQAALVSAANALEAAGHLQQTEQVKSQVLAAHEIRGDVLGWQAKYPESVQEFSEMLETATELNDSQAQARAWHGMAQSQMHQGDLRAAIASAEEEEAVGRQGELDLPVAKARWMQGWGAFRLGEIERAVELTGELADLGERIDDPGQRGENLNLLGVLRWASGDYAGAEQYFKEAMDVFQAEGDVRRAMPLANNLAVIAESRGDFESAADGYNDALRIAREIDNRDGEMVYLGNLGGAKLLQGDTVGAEQDLRAVLEMAGPQGIDVLPDILSHLAEAVLDQGQIDEAFQFATQALDTAANAESRDDLAAVWRVLGMVIAEMPQPPSLTHSPPGVAGVCDAGTCFAESERIFREIGRDDELARTLRSWAEHELVLGRRSQAEEKWEEAKGLFEKIGATHEVARMTELG